MDYTGIEPVSVEVARAPLINVETYIALNWKGMRVLALSDCVHQWPLLYGHSHRNSGRSSSPTSPTNLPRTGEVVKPPYCQLADSFRACVLSMSEYRLMDMRFTSWFGHRWFQGYHKITPYAVWREVVRHTVPYKYRAKLRYNDTLNRFIDVPWWIA